MKNTQIQEVCFQDTLSDKFQQIIALKFATLYLFYPFLSCFFCIKKFLFKNFIVCYLFKPVSELESCGTYCLNYHLILHTKAPCNVSIFQVSLNLGCQGEFLTIVTCHPIFISRFSVTSYILMITIIVHITSQV